MSKCTWLTSFNFSCKSPLAHSLLGSHAHLTSLTRMRICGGNIHQHSLNRHTPILFLPPFQPTGWPEHDADVWRALWWHWRGHWAFTFEQMCWTGLYFFQVDSKSEEVMSTYTHVCWLCRSQLSGNLGRQDLESVPMYLLLSAEGWSSMVPLGPVLTLGSSWCKGFKKHLVYIFMYLFCTGIQSGLSE